MPRYEYPNKSYYAYNETFVDDEGLELYQNDLRASQYLNEDEDDDLSIDNQSYQNRGQPDNSRHYQAVDRYDERLDYLNLSMREPPVGGAGATYRQHIEPMFTTSNVSRVAKQQQPQPQQQRQPHRYEVINPRRNRSSSVPSRRRVAASNEPNVLAPMTAQANRQLRRSQSTIISQSKQRHTDQARDFHYQARQCSTPRIQRQNSTPVRLKSYSHFIQPTETSLSQSEISAINARNMAIIPPNYRQDNQSSLPLLSHSPVKLQLMGSPNKSLSWMNISNQRLPTQPLWFAGLILLFSGGGSCLLCLYILSKIGRKYYLDFGAISGFVCLILGMIGCKTSRWLPHRHYVTGYILLSAFSLLQCGVLAILASDSKQLGNDLVDLAGGAICGLSALSITLATLGFLTSACCNLLPPDSRVSHSVQGFTV